MSMEKMEQLHLSVIPGTKQWFVENKGEFNCSSTNSFGRLIIKEFQDRASNGDATNKKENVTLSLNHIIWSVFIPLFLFVMGRINNNDPLLFSLGIVSLAGAVIYGIWIVRQ